MANSTNTLDRRESPEGGAHCTVVRGIVSPAGWNKKGQVVAVCIAPDTGPPFYVLPGGAADEVLECLKRFVAVSGNVFKRGTQHFVAAASVLPLPHPDFRGPFSFSDQD